MRRHWIPPWALALGQAAHAASWALLLVIATRRPFELGLPALAWLHLVVLGWLTLTALAVLVHVVPAFTDVPWKGEGIARSAIAFYAAGVLVLVCAFWTGNVATLPWAGSAIALALVAYCIPGVFTLSAAFAGPQREAAIARALTITLTALLVTALLGVLLTFALAGNAAPAVLSYVPPMHGTFGIAGWLTLLIMGVSTRTIRPISGAGSRFPVAHIISGSCVAAGVLAAVAGIALRAPGAVWVGLGAVCCGALVYAFDMADIVRRATVAHRPPQAFVGAAVAWLVIGLALCVLALGGASTGAAALFALVVGWIAQMVDGHVYHIGIRLVATMARGDDDETPPGELLVLPLSWLSFACFQVAVAGGTAALAFGVPDVLAASATAGIAGWVFMAANIATAARRSRRPPAEPKLVSLLG